MGRTSSQLISHLNTCMPMRGSRKFCQRGPNLIFFNFNFLIEEMIQVPLKSGIIEPQAKRHLMTFRQRVDDGQKLNAGLVALFFFLGGGGGGDPDLCVEKSYIYWIFTGSGPPAPLCGSVHACQISNMRNGKLGCGSSKVGCTNS